MNPPVDIGDMKVPTFYSQVLMREMQWHLSFVCPLSALSGEYTVGWFFDLPSFRVPPVTKLCCGSSYWYCLSITYTLSLRGILIRIKRQQFSIPGP